MAQVKRILLIVLLSLLGLIAAAVIVSLLLGGARMPTEVVLPTGMTEGFMLIVVLAAMQSLDRPVVRWLGLVGAAMALLTMMLAASFFFWSYTVRYPSPKWEVSQVLGNCLGTLVIAAAALCFLAFVYAARMNIFGRVMQVVTGIAIVVATGTMCLVVWTNISGWVGRLLESTLTGSVVVGGAGILGTFMLSKMLSIKLPDAVSAVRGTVFLRCPRCLKEQEVTTGESRCAACRLRFTIEVEEPRCPKCGYNLNSLTRPICPECGFHLSPEEVASPAAV